ncbi:hypothetical protein [Sorangium sp. So ce124]|uniref:hypothetical protein n=1 Tax=Sorangium sp. So ce124 TaxID=3133280 RepID=UPI003F63BD83
MKHFGAGPRLLRSCATSAAIPDSAGKAKTVLSLPPPDPCRIAAELRKLVPALLDKGTLDRTVRFIDKANWLCPATAAENRVVSTKLITSDSPLPVR